MNNKLVEELRGFQKKLVNVLGEIGVACELNETLSRHSKEAK